MLFLLVTDIFKCNKNQQTTGYTVTFCLANHTHRFSAMELF